MNPTIFLNQRRQLLNTGAISPSEVKEIVALELMTRIAEAEHAKKIKEKTDTPREYYLTLYSQCLQVVSGEDVEDVLEDFDD
jgi:hypothetical protein